MYLENIKIHVIFAIYLTKHSVIQYNNITFLTSTINHAFKKNEI
jgi:hypothetical protein